MERRQLWKKVTGAGLVSYLFADQRIRIQKNSLESILSDITSLVFNLRPPPSVLLTIFGAGLMSKFLQALVFRKSWYGVSTLTWQSINVDLTETVQTEYVYLDAHFRSGHYNILGLWPSLGRRCIFPHYFSFHIYSPLVSNCSRSRTRYCKSFIDHIRGLKNLNRYAQIHLPYSNRCVGGQLHWLGLGHARWPHWWRFLAKKTRKGLRRICAKNPSVESSQAFSKTSSARSVDANQTFHAGPCNDEGTHSFQLVLCRQQIPDGRWKEAEWRFYSKWRSFHSDGRAVVGFHAEACQWQGPLFDQKSFSDPECIGLGAEAAVQSFGAQIPCWNFSSY